MAEQGCGKASQSVKGEVQQVIKVYAGIDPETDVRSMVSTKGQWLRSPLA